MTAPGKTSAPPHHIPVRQDWLNLHREPILEPDLPIVDPHHHLWDRPGWRYLLDELLADTSSGHNITATVFLQCKAFHRADGPEELRPIGETEFANGIAAMAASGSYDKTLACAGIVSHADLALGTRVEAVLKAHVKAGNGRFRGIRHITACDPDPAVMNPGYTPPPGQLADPEFRDGLKTLGRMDLTFDAWLYHPQIPELTAAAKACPETSIVLDHVGGPLGYGTYTGRREAEFAGWEKSIRDLADCPNVFIKLGGLGMRINGFCFEEASAPPASDALVVAWKPYIETCIEAFGADRCMFESNFPVDKGSYSYPVFWNACKKLASGASASEKTALFSGTASRFYKI